MIVDRSNPGRSYFTLRELLVVVAIVALGLAILIPVIRESRVQSQRTQCTGNLKQIGLGIQIHHDIRQDISPSYLTDDHTSAALPNGFISWPMAQMPYMESNSVYSQIDFFLAMDRVAPRGDSDRVVALTSVVSTFICPARRDSHLRPVSFVVGDYANVSLAEATNEVIRGEPRTWDAAMLPTRAFNATTAPNVVALNGYQPGTLGGREYRSMTSFKSVTDGLSCTIFIGEKSARQDRLGSDLAYLVDAELPSHQDGTFYYGRGGNPASLHAPGAMAFWSRRLAPAKASERLLPAKPRFEDPQNRFGGWHPGVTLFLMGDGQVKVLSKGTSTLLLQRLGSRNDGQWVELP